MAASAPTAPAARIRQLSPAMNISEAPVKASSRAVPRSGWWATISTGAPINPAGTSSFQDSLASSADRPW